MRELESLSNGGLAGYDSFAVVRNPYARLVSDYLWRQQLRRQFPDAPIRVFHSFEGFVHAIPEDLDCRWFEHVENQDREHASFLIHVRPQYQYVFDLKGECLVDEIFRFERLDLDMAPLFERHRLSQTGIRAGPERDFEAYYSRALLDRVNEIDVLDFECFSYGMR